jgi:hypothetical protein
VKLFFCLVILLPVAIRSLAQGNSYTEGYIVRTSGDTIRGFIDERALDRNPKIITIKSSIRAGYSTSYKSLELKSARTGRLFYTNKRVGSDTLFLKVILEGEISLYYLKDANKEDHFYAENSEGIQALTNGSGDGKFRWQLDQYLANCKPGLGSNGHLQYTEKSLRELLETYYKCRSISPGFIFTKEKAKLELGLMAGLSNTTHHFYQKLLVTAPNTINLSSIGVPIGLNFEAFPPGMGRKFAFCLEALYVKNQFTGGGYDFGVWYAQFNPMFRFYLRSANGPFLNAGLSYVIVRSESKILQFDDGIGLNVGLGFRWNRFSLEARYSTGPGVRGATIYSTMESFSLLTGFRFL